MAAGAALAAAPVIRARAAPPAGTLILIKLAGGNDGLNTLVPFDDPAYRRARPSVGLTRNAVLPLGEGLGLHPGLAPLEDAWATGDMAIVRGVGFRPADRSHFRSMDVWETGGDGDGPQPTGWLTRALHAAPSGAESLGLVVIGSDPRVILAGSGLAGYDIAAGAALATPDPTQSIGPAQTANPALAHVLATERLLALAQAELAVVLDRLPAFASAFPDNDLGRRLVLAARLIAAGSPAPVILLPVTGFDTHAGQRAVHDALLAGLGEGLAALRLGLIEAGAWHRTTVATYSEFGRRVADNASGGTDHGTAAPHFVLGGGVAGGFHGAQPSLADLADRDPEPTIDLRAYLGGLAVAGLGLAPADARLALGHVDPLALGTAP